MINYDDEYNKIVKRHNIGKINPQQAKFELAKLNAYAARNNSQWHHKQQPINITKEMINNDADGLINDWRNHKLVTHDFYRECDKLTALCEQLNYRVPFEHDFINTLVINRINLLMENDDLYSELNDDESEDIYDDEEEEMEDEIVYSVELNGHTVELLQAGSGSIYLIIDGENVDDEYNGSIEHVLEILAAICSAEVYNTTLNNIKNDAESKADNDDDIIFIMTYEIIDVIRDRIITTYEETL